MQHEPQVAAPFPDALMLARLETRWHAPWLIAGLSHWGQHHAEIGLPNQDAFATGSVGGVTWLAVADGVSAKPCSGEGAAIAVHTVGKEITRRLKTVAMIDERSLLQVIEASRRGIGLQAANSRRPLSDYATTLLVAVLHRDSITVAKIGDGYVLALERHQGGSTLVPLVENPLQRAGGEVVDLTHSTWKSLIRVRHIPDRAAAGIDTVALGTDGCSRYFLKAAPTVDGEPRAVLNADLIDGQLAGNLKRLGARNLFVYLANLLGHRQFVDEGDDRTLLIATMASSESLSCSPSMA